MGVNTEGYAFIDQKTKRIPDDFDWNNFYLQLIGEKSPEGYMISLRVLDAAGNNVLNIKTVPENAVRGIVQIVNDFRSARSKDNGLRFWYDDL